MIDRRKRQEKVTYLSVYRTGGAVGAKPGLVVVVVAPAGSTAVVVAKVTGDPAGVVVVSTPIGSQLCPGSMVMVAPGSAVLVFVGEAVFVSGPAGPAVV